MPAPVVDKRLLLAVAAGSILLSPLLFAYELVMSIVLVGFGFAFRSLRPVAAARLVTIGAVLRRRATGWHVSLVAAKGSPVERIGLGPARPPASTERILTTNGGLPVALLNGTVPAADQKTAITTARST